MKLIADATLRAIVESGTTSVGITLEDAIELSALAGRPGIPVARLLTPHLPPVRVDPRPFGAEICSIGGARQIVNSRRIENLNGPGDLGKTAPLFAITDDWLDLVYCLSARVPVNPQG